MPKKRAGNGAVSAKEAKDIGAEETGLAAGQGPASSDSDMGTGERAVGGVVPADVEAEGAPQGLNGSTGVETDGERGERRAPAGVETEELTQEQPVSPIIETKGMGEEEAVGVEAGSGVAVEEEVDRAEVASEGAAKREPDPVETGAEPRVDEEMARDESEQEVVGGGPTPPGVEAERAAEEESTLADDGSALLAEEESAPGETEAEVTAEGKTGPAEVVAKAIVEDAVAPVQITADGIAKEPPTGSQTEDLVDEAETAAAEEPDPTDHETAEPAEQKAPLPGIGAESALAAGIASAAGGEASGDEIPSPDRGGEVAVENETTPIGEGSEEGPRQKVAGSKAQQEMVEGGAAPVEVEGKEIAGEEPGPASEEGADRAGLMPPEDVAEEQPTVVQAAARAAVTAGAALAGAMEEGGAEISAAGVPAGAERATGEEPAPAETEAAQPAQGEGAPAPSGEGVVPEGVAVAAAAQEGAPAPSGEGAGDESVAAAAVEADAAAGVGKPDQEEKKRRRLLLSLLALLFLLLSVTALFWRYLRQPAPLPDLLPVSARVNYPPHYLFSIYGVESPVGVAVSPQGDRIYVAETGGERLVKVFDQDGASLSSFAPPRTVPAERAPVYLVADATGRVFVTDRLQRAVFVYERDGQYQDTILGPDLTLSEYVAKQVGGLQPGTSLAYNLFEPVVYYQTPDGVQQSLPAPDPAGWAPLGIRIDRTSTLLLTDVAADRHAVREIPGDVVLAATWQEFDPPEIRFGANGHGNGEFLFPNSAVVDSQGRIYVTDGNNSRICVWDGRGEFLFGFGQGIGESALSLPRGAAMDARDRLHVVDAVEQSVKVYDVSGLEPRFLYAFGDWGLDDGEFNYPNDIALDASGRLYVADRENNRIQVWSY